MRVRNNSGSKSVVAEWYNLPKVCAPTASVRVDDYKINNKILCTHIRVDGDGGWEKIVQEPGRITSH